jgi:hypothetical protein
MEKGIVLITQVRPSYHIASVRFVRQVEANRHPAEQTEARNYV